MHLHGKGEIMGRLMKKIKNKQYGQAMAEFALTLPIFLLLVFGVIELSRFFLVYSSVFTASREATRFGASVGDINNQNYLNCAAIAERAVFSGSFGGVQLNDITISYESTPGTIVAICPDLSSGSVPLISGCTGSKCEYEPELGHRILVEIVTDFDTLLGIVPDLPVRAINGRTILKEVKVLIPPVERPLCPDNVSFDGELYHPEDDPTKISINVINDSTISYYIIYHIENINWETEDEEPKILEIQWNNGQIWHPTDLDNDGNIDNELPDFSILSWDEAEGRYLPAKENEEDEPESSTLTFVFDSEVEIDAEDGVDFSFDLVVLNNASLYEDVCNPVE